MNNLRFCCMAIGSILAIQRDKVNELLVYVGSFSRSGWLFIVASSPCRRVNTSCQVRHKERSELLLYVGCFRSGKTWRQRIMM